MFRGPNGAHGTETQSKQVRCLLMMKQRICRQPNRVRETLFRPAVGSSWRELVLALALVAVALLTFRNSGMQSLNWLYPYVSGAANLSADLGWRMSVSDFNVASELPPADVWGYRFQATSDTIPYSINNYGYVIVAFVARTLFGHFGDINALILLQSLAHIVIVAVVWLWILQSRTQRWAFIIIFGCNPAIIHVVTFPFYYFWTVVPSVILLLTTSGGIASVPRLAVATCALAMSVLVRPTVVLLALLASVAPVLARPRVINRFIAAGFLVALAMFIGTLGAGSRASPFHTMYIGLGAYPNSVGVEMLADEEGYRYYAEQRGVQISTRAVGGNYADPVIRDDYFGLLKRRYLEVLWSNPWLVTRNAAANMLQCFGLGYSTKSLAVNLASVAIGAMVSAMLVIRRQWPVVFGVLAYSATYAWYFPPIPAYNFGVYLLLAVGVIRCFDRRSSQERATSTRSAASRSDIG